MLSTISLELSSRRILVEKDKDLTLKLEIKKDLIESLHIDTI